MYCSFEQRFGVLSSLFIRTVVVDLSAFLRINYFPVLNTLCERSALPRWQIVFWFNNKPSNKSLTTKQVITQRDIQGTSLDLLQERKVP